MSFSSAVFARDPRWGRCRARRPCASAWAKIPTCSIRPLARTFVGRIVSAGPCATKLFDIDEKLAIVPVLATGYEWSNDYKALTLKLRRGVTFHDGEKLDAAAVKFNIERHKTMAGSEPPRRAGAGDERRRRRSADGAAQPAVAGFAVARRAADRAG